MKRTLAVSLVCLPLATWVGAQETQQELTKVEKGWVKVLAGSRCNHTEPLLWSRDLPPENSSSLSARIPRRKALKAVLGKRW